MQYLLCSLQMYVKASVLTMNSIIIFSPKVITIGAKNMVPPIGLLLRTASHSYASYLISYLQNTKYKSQNTKTIEIFERIYFAYNRPEWFVQVNFSFLRIIISGILPQYFKSCLLNYKRNFTFPTEIH